MKGSRKQEVTQQYTGLRIPPLVDRLTMPSHCCHVQDVIVDQGGRMDHLNHRRQQDMPISYPANRLGDQQQQDRTQSLAT